MEQEDAKLSVKSIQNHAMLLRPPSELYQHKQAMADFCCTSELDDLHRLLPTEILADIGVADAVVDHTTARCSHGDDAVDVE